MTPARKAALQWFHDRGEVNVCDLALNMLDGQPSLRMISTMAYDGHLSIDELTDECTLTDKGRRALNDNS